MAKYYLVRKTDSVSELADVAVSSPSTGQVLKWDGTNWINDTDATGGGGEVAPVTITTNTTAATDKHTYLVNASGGAVTLTLPTAVGRAGKVYAVKKIDATTNAVTIDGATTETIDGALTTDTALQWDVVTIESDGANWQTITPPTGTASGSYRTLVEQVADVNNATTSFVDTDLSFAVTANQVYRYEGVLIYNSTAFTAGLALGVSGPGTPDFATIETANEVSSGALSRNVGHGFGLTLASAGNNSLAGAMCRFYGFFKTPTSGTFKIQFKNDETISTITVKAGSTLEWW